MIFVTYTLSRRMYLRFYRMIKKLSIHNCIKTKDIRFINLPPIRFFKSKKLNKKRITFNSQRLKNNKIIRSLPNRSFWYISFYVF